MREPARILGQDHPPDRGFCLRLLKERSAALFGDDVGVCIDVGHIALQATKFDEAVPLTMIVVAADTGCIWEVPQGGPGHD